MLKLLKYCYQRGLIGRLGFLLTVGSLGALLSIAFAERLAAWVQSQSAQAAPSHWVEMLLVVALFAASTALTLCAEYQSQILSARIAGRMGGDFIYRFRFKEISSGSIEAAKTDITATLLSQMERYRQDYLMMATSLIVRVIILGTLAVFLIASHPVQTLLALALGMAFLAMNYLVLRSLARLIDAQLTLGNHGLGDVVTRTSRNILAVALTGIRSEAIRRYEQSFKDLGMGRGLGSLMSLLPKFLIEMLVLLSLLVLAFTEGGLKVETDALVFFGTLALRFNPHLQILIKNLSIMQSARPASHLIQLGFNSVAESRHADEPAEDAVITVDSVSWSYRRERWLRINGPSGSGKSTFLLKAANELQKASVPIAMIQNNDEIPLFSFSGDNLDRSALLADIAQMGLAHLDERLGQCEPDTWDVQGLSNGERQRVLTAMSVRAGARVLMLDEGFSALDDASLSLMLRYLDSQEVSVLFCCHGHVEQIRRELGGSLLEHNICAARKALRADKPDL